VAAWRAARARPTAARRALGGGAALLALATVAYGCAMLNVFWQEDPRHQATRWMAANVPTGAAVFVEKDGMSPEIDLHRFDVRALDWGRYYDTPRTMADWYHPERAAWWRWLADRAQPALVADLGAPRDLDADLAKALDGAQWAVLSERSYDLLVVDRPANARARAFYEEMFGEQGAWRLARTFAVQPSLLGVTLDDRGAETTFRIFDHPRIWIFAKK
jgi:hypothetical protein